MTRRIRSENIHLRLTKEEKDYIDNKMAETRTYNYTDMFIKAVSKMEYYVVDTRPLFDVAGEINRIGTNINQIAKVANTTHSIYKDDIKELREHMNKLTEIVQQNFEVFSKAREGI